MVKTHTRCPCRLIAVDHYRGRKARGIITKGLRSGRDRREGVCGRNAWFVDGMLNDGSPNLGIRRRRGSNTDRLSNCPALRDGNRQRRVARVATRPRIGWRRVKAW